MSLSLPLQGSSRFHNSCLSLCHFRPTIARRFVMGGTCATQLAGKVYFRGHRLANDAIQPRHCHVASKDFSAE